MLDWGIEPRPLRTADATRLAVPSSKIHRRPRLLEYEWRSAFFWSRRALANRRIQNLVAHLRASYPHPAASESRESSWILFFARASSGHLACRQQPPARPRTLFSRRLIAASSSGNRSAGREGGTVERAIRAAGGTGRRILAQGNAALRSPEQTSVDPEDRHHSPEECFVSKIPDSNDLCFFEVVVCRAARFGALTWRGSAGANLSDRLDHS